MKPYRDCRERIIAPSMLAADWSRVGEETSRAIRAGADWILTYHAADAAGWLAEGRLA